VNNTAKHPDLFDCKWALFNHTLDELHGEFLSLPDHCKYRYLAVPEGFANVNRLKFLFNCGSVIFYKPRYYEHFTHLLQDNIHYVEYHVDVNDVYEKIQRLQRHPSQGAKIASNAVSFAQQYLSLEATFCYLRHAIRRYADLCIDCAVLDFSKYGAISVHEYWMRASEHGMTTFTLNNLPI